MLSRVIASPACNLVRLSAAGCYFGDAEVTVLANGLEVCSDCIVEYNNIQKNKSLVYLSDIFLNSLNKSIISVEYIESKYSKL